MIKAAIVAFSLAATLPAAAQDWIEIADYGGSGESASHFVFIDASKIASAGNRRFSAPYLEVNRSSFVERTITVSCGIKLELAASQWQDRRGGRGYAASPSARKLIGSAAGALAGPALGAAFAPPRKQDVLLGRWLCDPARPVGGVQFIRRPGDPKPVAWRQLDANWAKLPGRINAQLASALPSLRYIAPGQTNGVSRVRIEGCELALVTDAGRAVRLPIRRLQPHRGGASRLVFADLQTDTSVALGGLPPELADPIGGGLTAIKSDC